MQPDNYFNVPGLHKRTFFTRRQCKIDCAFAKMHSTVIRYPERSELTGRFGRGNYFNRVARPFFPFIYLLARFFSMRSFSIAGYCPTMWLKYAER